MMIELKVILHKGLMFNNHLGAFIRVIPILIFAAPEGVTLSGVAVTDSNKCTSLVSLQHQFQRPLALNLSTILENGGFITHIADRHGQTTAAYASTDELGNVTLFIMWKWVV